MTSPPKPITPAESTETSHVLAKSPRGPVRWLLGLFSSIWLGITLLSLLFIYSSIGSAGFWLPGTGHFHVRQWRIFEMTEFEWFHYWPFDLLIVLICINIIVATLRRIPFKPINYGVWMIHTGILILAGGSLWYFGTKVEGEAIVGRRLVTLSLPSVDPVTFAAQPGKIARVASDDVTYNVQVASIDPQWELLSGDDKGKLGYAVTLNIQRSDATGEHMFMRQLIANRPQYTEDIVRTNNHTQPMQRAKKINPDGNPLVDQTLDVSLEYQPQQYMYLVNSAALYLREIDAEGNPKTGWIQRPIDDLPRYHEYIRDYESVWLPPSDMPPPLDELDIEVDAAEPTSDPLAEQSITITDFLRYAVMDDRRMPGSDTLDPVVTLELAAADGRRALYELVALDPLKRSAENGELLFVWVDSEDELAALRDAPGPQLSISVPDQQHGEVNDIQTTLQRNPNVPFEPIGETGYSYRVENLQDNLVINPQLTVSVAMVQIRTPDDETFMRMVRSDAADAMDFPLANQIMAHDQPLPRDESIIMTYQPGDHTAAVTVVAGPQREQLHLLNAVHPTNRTLQPIDIGQSVDLGGATLSIRRYASNTFVAERPAVIARSQRNKSIGSQLSMIRAIVPTTSGDKHLWLPFHLFPFEREAAAAYRFRYEPIRVVLDEGATESAADDRIVELMYSRRRVSLPAPVVLDDFILSTHTGGFTSNASIRNWTSVVRFADQSQRHDAWLESMEVSVNEPIEFGGYWYFQSRWDAPDGVSLGHNHTVLGVGNRNGVNVMLAGCCIAVIGMMYAFYVKPLLRRRKILKVHEAIAHNEQRNSSNGTTPPVAPYVSSRESSLVTSKERAS